VFGSTAGGILKPRSSPYEFCSAVDLGRRADQPDLAAFLSSPDNYDARLLSLESSAPRARTYADRLPEGSREVTLVAEAALYSHIRQRQPVIAHFFLG
jgi:hypothetical protein